MKQIVTLLVFAGVAGYGVLGYHYVLFDENLKVLRKTGLRYENTFIDARGVKKLEVALKPDLVAAGIHKLIGQVDSTLKENIN